MNRNERRRINRSSKKRPSKFLDVPESEWPPKNSREIGRYKVFVNDTFLVQLFNGGNDIIRMTISYTEKDSNGQWKDGITWDELQSVKTAIGFGDTFGVEAYPEIINVVNVANMRHIFLLPERPDWAWSN